ncbi:MAG: tetratricopeptide repeat protein [Phycisphaerales bacterium]|nr:MAG: tetratricopeptide repeat protein [Phycisphaerales bacterium]
MGQSDRAVTDYTKAIVLKPVNAEVYHNRGLAYANKDDSNLAIIDYTKVIGIKSDCAEFYNSRG